MHPRHLFLALVLILLTGILSAQSDPVRHRFGLAYFSPTPDIDDCIAGIIEGLAQGGLKENTDYTLDQINVQGNPASLGALADAVAANHYELVFTLSTPALKAVSDRLADTPVIATYIADPVAAGVASSPAHHRANVTGIVTTTDFAGMRSLLSSLLPKAKVVGTLYAPTEPNSLLYLRMMKDEFSRGGITLVTEPAVSLESLGEASAKLCRQTPDAICQITDNLSLTGIGVLSRTALDKSIPVFAFTGSAVKDGQAVAAVALDYRRCGVEAGLLALRVLNGENPANIPFAQSTGARIHLNTELASRLGIRIPDSLRKKADFIYPQPLK